MQHLFDLPAFTRDQAHAPWHNGKTPDARARLRADINYQLCTAGPGMQEIAVHRDLPVEDLEAVAAEFIRAGWDVHVETLERAIVIR